MGFGKQLRFLAIWEFAAFYLDYAQLKAILAESRKARASPEAFLAAADQEAQRVEALHARLLTSVSARLSDLEARVGHFVVSPTASQSEQSVLLRALRDAADRLSDLQEFAGVNLQGFRRLQRKASERLSAPEATARWGELLARRYGFAQGGRLHLAKEKARTLIRQVVLSGRLRFPRSSSPTTAGGQAGAADPGAADPGAATLETQAGVGRKMTALESADASVARFAASPLLSSAQSPRDVVAAAISRGDATTVAMVVRAGRLSAAEALALSGPLLHCAAEAGDEALLRWALNLGADPSARNIVDASVLHTAARCNQPGSMRVLLAAGAGIHCVDIRGQTALHAAVEGDSADCCRLLVQQAASHHLGALRKGSHRSLRGFQAAAATTGASAEGVGSATADLAAAPDLNENSPLLLACRLGHADCVRVLLTATSGALQAPDLEAGGSGGDEWELGEVGALHHAASAASLPAPAARPESVGLSVSGGGGAPTTSPPPTSMLARPPRVGLPPPASLGAGSTAASAADGGSLARAISLPALGMAGSSAGGQPGDAASAAAGPGAASRRSTLISTAPPGSPRPTDGTPTERGSPAAAPKRLPMRSVAPWQWSLYHAAMVAGHVDCIRALTDAGASGAVNHRVGSVANTALHVAASVGSVEGVRALLRAGASVGLINAHGETPAHLAARYGFAEALQLLLSQAPRWLLRASEPSVTDLGLENSRASATDLASKWVPIAHDAIHSGSLACLQALLAAGVDPGEANASGWTAHAVAVYVGRQDMAEVCQQTGLIGPNRATKAGVPPRHRASPLVEEARHEAASPTSTNSTGATSLPSATSLDATNSSSSAAEAVAGDPLRRARGASGASPDAPSLDGAQPPAWLLRPGQWELRLQLGTLPLAGAASAVSHHQPAVRVCRRSFASTFARQAGSEHADEDGLAEALRLLRLPGRRRARLTMHLQPAVTAAAATTTAAAASRPGAAGKAQEVDMQLSDMSQPGGECAAASSSSQAVGAVRCITQPTAPNEELWSAMPGDHIDSLDEPVVLSSTAEMLCAALVIRLEAVGGEVVGQAVCPVGALLSTWQGPIAAGASMGGRQKAFAAAVERAMPALDAFASVERQVEAPAPVAGTAAPMPALGAFASVERQIEAPAPVAGTTASMPAGTAPGPSELYLYPWGQRDGMRMRGQTAIALVCPRTGSVVGQVGFRYFFVRWYAPPASLPRAPAQVAASAGAEDRGTGPSPHWHGVRSARWTSASMQVFGHRGAGADSASTPVLGPAGERLRRTHVSENTVLSLVTAAAQGAAFVEFDVQLSADRVPVIHHDLLVKLPGGGRVPVSHLTAKQFQSMRPIHPDDDDADTDRAVAAAAAAAAADPDSRQRRLRLEQLGVLDGPSRQGGKGSRSHGAEVEAAIQQLLESGQAHTSPHFRRRRTGRVLNELGVDGGWHVSQSGVYYGLRDSFCTLRDALTLVPERAGFNIELKFASDREMVQLGLRPPDRNDTIDAVLDCLHHHGGNRAIMFSSFDPEICVALSRKQCFYPVFFLTEAGTERLRDPRRNSLRAAVRFARSLNLMGIVSEASVLVQAPRLMNAVCGSGLRLCTYGKINNSASAVRLQRRHGVDAVIVDHVAHIQRAINAAEGAADGAAAQVGEGDEGDGGVAAGIAVRNNLKREPGVDV